MRQKKRRNSGTVPVSIALLIIAALIVLSIVRFFWVDNANEHYDKMVSAYIEQTEDYKAEDGNELKRKLLEDGIFIKMHRWDKESFIKDKQLYNEMIKMYRKQQQEKEAGGSVVDGLINL